MNVKTWNNHFLSSLHSSRYLPQLHSILSFAVFVYFPCFHLYYFVYARSISSVRIHVHFKIHFRFLQIVGVVVEAEEGAKNCQIGLPSEVPIKSITKLTTIVCELDENYSLFEMCWRHRSSAKHKKMCCVISCKSQQNTYLFVID